MFGKYYPTLQIPRKDLSGKLALVTGANTGIGFEIASSLAQQGATVYLACRNKEKGEAAASKICDTGAKAFFVHLDLSSLEAVRAFQWNQKIDILVHNAGITNVESGDTRAVETTNFYAPFLLTSRLEKFIKDARIVFTSSGAVYSYKHGGEKAAAYTYGITKVQQIQLAKALALRGYRGANAYTPGFCTTSLFDKLDPVPFTKDPLFWFLRECGNLCTPASQGAATGIWLATSDDPTVKKGGLFWDRCVVRCTEVDWNSDQDIKKLWNEWCEETGARWSS